MKGLRSAVRRSLVLLAACAAFAGGAARADAVDTLREFVRDVKSGSAQFTQTVSSPDGAKKKTSQGSFEFLRPNRFRFAYAKPDEQLIVGDGQKVWLYDVDLQQVSVRPMDQVLGATPAALLAGSSLEKDFELSALPASQGLEWVQALPRLKDAGVQSLRIGFQDKRLAAVEIVDSFGQRSMLRFSQLVPNAAVAPESFKFVAPKGVEVLAQ